MATLEVHLMEKALPLPLAVQVEMVGTQGIAWALPRARIPEVGFAHGVMNTDNLSLLGTTVDLILGQKGHSTT